MTFKFKDIGTTPPNPPAGYVGLFCDTDVLKWINSAGTVTSIASGTGDLKADGSIPLTANWDVGAFKITALQLESDVVTGTPPLIVASTTAVPNLNADKLDGADLIDEDNMASDSAVHVPTQQSVKAYVDSSVAGGVTYKGGYDASTNTPDLDTAPSGVITGDMYAVTVAGTFFTEDVQAGDILIANTDSASTLAHWEILENNLTAAPLFNVVEDTSPQLGANLDTNGFGLNHATVIPFKIAGTSVFAMNASAIYPLTNGDKDLGLNTTRFQRGFFDQVSINQHFYWSDGYTVGSLPAATTEGIVARVTDATAPEIGATVAGGGAVPCIVYSDGTNWKVIAGGTMPAGGGGGLTPVFKSAAYTASAGEVVYLLTATAGAAFGQTLPASPSTGAQVSYWDAEDSAGDYNVTIARNGQTIGGVAEDFVLNVSGGRVDFAFDGTTWQVVYSTPGASGFTGKKRIYLRPGVELISSGTPALSTQVLLAGSFRRADIFTLSASADNNFYFNGPLPKSWDQGGVRARFYWQPSSTNTGDAMFAVIPLTAAADGEAFSDTLGGSVSVLDAGAGITSALQITDWTDTVTFPGIGDDHFVSIIFQRKGAHASDTFTGTSQLLGVELEYTTDAPTDD